MTGRKKYYKAAIFSPVVLCLAMVFFTGCYNSPIQPFAEAIPEVPDLNISVSDNPLPLLKVKGNQIVTSAGRRIILKGMNIGDLLDLYDQGHLTEDYFHKAADWGAGLIRIPVSPGNFRKHGDEDSFKVLDKAVGFCERYGMYVIIDWHSEGDLIHNLFDKTYNGFITSREEMSAFWKEAASRYKDRPAVAFYEIFNEPHGFDNSLAWKDWRDFADGIIDQIYAVNPRAIPLVSGLAYASDLRDFRSFPLRNKGVALAVHIYPGTYMKSSTAAKLPPETNWTAAWGYLCKDYPIIITEFGFDRNDTIEPSSFKEDPSWGEKAVNFARERNISWTAFVFYKNKYWPMPLFSDWKTYKATEAGAFFKKELIGETSN